MRRKKVKSTDRLLELIKIELELLRGDRRLHAQDMDQCPRRDHELNAINMAEAAVDRAAVKYRNSVPKVSDFSAGGMVVSFDPPHDRGPAMYAAGFRDGLEHGRR